MLCSGYSSLGFYFFLPFMQKHSKPKSLDAHPKQVFNNTRSIAKGSPLIKLLLETGPIGNEGTYRA